MDYNGERFLDVLYKELYKSEEVLHTKEKNDTKEKSIKRYMDRLESIHSKANTQSKKDLIKSLYFKKYVIKEENLSDYLSDEEKQGIIESQKKSLSTWIDYLTDENAKYPMWAKYWVFHQILKMGIYDEVNNKYTKRTKNTVNPFVEANPEIIAKAIGNIVKLLGEEKLTTQELRNIISNISFEKMYIEYQKNRKKQYKSNKGIWIKYNQYSEEDAIKLAASLEDKNTAWCTASESTAVAQLCGGYGYNGGDFYVYYTEDEEGNYNIPRIAIRLDGYTNIAEIRGVEEHQNLEEEMIPILESKLKEMTFLNEMDVYNNIKTVNKLKYLVSIKEKTLNNIILTEREIIDLYTKDYGFGWENDPLVNKIIDKRNILEDYNTLKNNEDKIEFIKKNIYKLISLDAEKFVKDEDVIISVLCWYDSSEEVFNFASDELQNDIDFIFEVLKTDGNLLKCVKDEFKNDKELVLVAVNNDGYAVEYASENLKKDREIVLTAVGRNGFVLEGLSNDWKDDKEIVLTAVEKTGVALCYASDRLKNDKEIVLTAVKGTALALEDASEELKDDKEIILVAVKQHSETLKFASDRLRNDKDVVLTAVKYGASAFKYASNELKNDKDFIFELINVNHGVFHDLPIDFKKDKEFAIAVVRKKGGMLRFLDKSLRMDREVVLAAINNDYEAIKYAYKETGDGLNDRELLLAAVRKNVKALRYAGYLFIEGSFNPRDILSSASYRLLHDKDLKYDGAQLRHLSDEFQKDKEIVMIAVKHCGYALRYASVELKDDRQVVMEALKKDGCALQYASERLRNTERVVLAAIRQNKGALKYVGNKLKTNKFVSKLVSCGITYQDLYVYQFMDTLEPDLNINPNNGLRK